MKTIDRVLQDIRISKVRPYLRPGSRLLDIGCGDGALFRRLGASIGESVGIDPDLDRSVAFGRHRLIAGPFPDALPEEHPFDLIALLAVLEHVPEALQPSFADRCRILLKPGGHLIATVPSPHVDRILYLLKSLHLIDGMVLEEHHEFDAHMTPALFAGLELVRAARFECGLNNLFVFQKPRERVAPTVRHDGEDVRARDEPWGRIPVDPRL